MNILTNVEFQVLINNRPVKTYGHNNKVYIEGRTGVEFTLKIKNNNAFRVLAVPSIDGLSVINGKEANDDSSGYIVEAYSSFEVKGWRTSLNDVSKFIFCKRGNSLSNQTGYGFDNCGVIGCRIFLEKKTIGINPTKKSSDWQEQPMKGINPFEPYKCPYPYPYQPLYPNTPYQPLNPTSPYLTPPPNIIWSKYDTNTFKNNNIYNTHISTFSCTTETDSSTQTLNYKSGNVPKFKLGTDYGESITSQAVECEFKTGAILDVFEIYYTTANELKKIGIDLDKKNAKINIPKAFKETKFCVLPKKNK